MMNWTLVAAVAVGFAALIWAGAPAARAAALPVRASGGQQTQDVAPMAEAKFWALVGATTLYEADPRAQLAALKRELDKLPASELEAYEARFDALMKASYRWSLWGAAAVAHGGASDDGFEYFRCWLISKGRQVFEAVVADPDHLADVVGSPGASVGEDGVLEFESFAYAARETWGRKTGRDAGLMPTAASMIHPGLQPGGESWTDEDLPGRFPRLWVRFGTTPLP